MDDGIIADTPRRSWRRRGLLMGAGLAAGLVVGAGVGVATRKTSLLGTPWEDQLAMLLGVSLLVFGAAVAMASLFRRSVAFVADPYAESGGGAPRRSEAIYQRLTGVCLALAGAMLLTPLVVGTAGSSGSWALRAAAMAGLVVAFALQSWINLALWRRSDELFRRLILDSSAISFWSLQGVLFLWAAGERLRLLPAITAWQACIVMLAGYLMASVAVNLRRGLS